MHDRRNCEETGNEYAVRKPKDRVNTVKVRVIWPVKLERILTV